MEKEVPRKSTKKRQEKESERRVEESSAPQVKLPSESKSQTFTAKVNNLSEIAEPTKASETKVSKQSSSVAPKFSAVVVAQGQSQKIKEVLYHSRLRQEKGFHLINKKSKLTSTLTSQP